MEDISQMRKRHEKERRELQTNCEHLKSTRKVFSWELLDFLGDVEVCDFCWKILKHYPITEIKATATDSKEVGHETLA